jgi:lysine/arginine/ornithine transport system substrate-binding protein
VRKGDEALKAKLNEAIAKLKADGSVKSLGAKYFGDIDISTK